MKDTIQEMVAMQTQMKATQTLLSYVSTSCVVFGVGIVIMFMYPTSFWFLGYIVISIFLLIAGFVVYKEKNDYLKPYLPIDNED